VLRSDALGHTLETALLKGDFAAASGTMGELQALLDGLSGQRSDTVERAIALARASGCAAKQSGASGGDSVLLVAPDPEAAARATASLTERGFVVSGVLAAEKGLHGEVQRNARLTSWIDALEP